MKVISVLVVLALASFVCAQNVTVGFARIRGTTANPGLFGSALFTVTGTNVTIALNVSGITGNLNTTHGVHIHSFGDLTLANGTSVGSHWNSNNMPHGCPENGTTRQIGDTGNWFVDADGNLVGEKTLDLISLTGSTSSVIGFGIIVHNVTDNCVGETSSGARLGQGVIGIANPTLHGGSQNLAAPIETYSANSGASQAVCVLTSAALQVAGAGQVTGTVFFTQTANGVQVSARISGLLDNKPRGFHIHQWGDLSSTDGSSAGPHYTGPYLDPAQPHGIPDGGSRPHHVGDLGNIYNYDANLTATYYGTYNFFTIYGTTLPSIIGRAVVLHNNTDDCTGATGNSGSRIAYCVIGPANPAFGGANAQLTTVPSAQSAANCPAIIPTSGIQATTGMMGTSGMMGSTGADMGTTGMVAQATTQSAAVVTTNSGSSSSVCFVLVAAIVSALLF